MRINGYKIREALKLWNNKREATLSLFEGSLTKFKDEEKKSPDDVMSDFLEAEAAIAELQTEQMRYNLEVNIRVNGNSMTLAEAIKKIGGVGRVEKAWKAASKPIVKGRYGGVESKVLSSKNADTEYAERVVSFEEALAKAEAAGREAATLREAIAVGNGREVDSGLSPELLGG